MKRLPLIILLLLTLSACTKTIHTVDVVEVPVVHHSVKIDTIRDSIERLDSVYIFQKGDTVYQQRVKETVKWKERIKVVNTTDTITNVVKVEKPVMVEKRLNTWQRFRISLGDIAMGVVGIIMIYGIYKLWCRIKR